MEIDKSRIAELVVKIQNGDNSAFDELYKATNQRAFFVALEFVKNDSDAEDILQESYIKALSKIKELDKPESFQSWLNQIVANKSKDYLKKKKPMLFEAEENEVFELIPDEDTDFTPEDNLDKTELQRAVMEVLDELGEEKKACVMMMYFEELSVGEIAQALEIPEGTVKTRLFSARKDLKGKFEKRGITSAYSVAPIGVVLWAMRRTAESVQKSFIAGPAPAKILAGISASGTAAGATAAATGGAAVATAGAGTAAGASAVASAGGSIAAKIAALTVAQKVIAGVSVAAVVAGSAAGVATVANNASKNETASTTTIIEESTTAPNAENITVQAAAGTVEFIVSETSETLSVQNVSTTVQSSGGTSAVSGTAASSTKPASTTKQQTTKPATTKATTQSATKPTTTKPSASNTTTTRASVAKTTKPTTKPSTKPAQTVPKTEPPKTETTTKKVTTTQAAPKLVIYYMIDGVSNDFEVIPEISVNHNDRIDETYLKNEVEKYLNRNFEVFMLYEGEVVESAEYEKTYTFKVLCK